VRPWKRSYECEAWRWRHNKGKSLWAVTYVANRHHLLSVGQPTEDEHTQSICDCSDGLKPQRILNRDLSTPQRIATNAVDRKSHQITVSKHVSQVQERGRGRGRHLMWGLVPTRE